MKRQPLWALVLVLAGCASAPRNPSVLVLPGIGKSFEQFHGDDAACRQFANDSVQKEQGAEARQEMQRQYDLSYQQCMYSKGHRVPANGTMAQLTPPGYPPPYPAGRPPQ